MAEKKMKRKVYSEDEKLAISCRFSFIRHEICQLQDMFDDDETIIVGKLNSVWMGLAVIEKKFIKLHA